MDISMLFRIVMMTEKNILDDIDNLLEESKHKYYILKTKMTKVNKSCDELLKCFEEEP